MLRLPRSYIKLGILVISIGFLIILMWHFQVEWKLKNKFIKYKRLTQKVTIHVSSGERPSEENGILHGRIDGDRRRGGNGDEIEITERSSLQRGISRKKGGKHKLKVFLNKLKAQTKRGTKWFPGLNKQRVSSQSRIYSSTKMAITLIDRSNYVTPTQPITRLEKQNVTTITPAGTTKEKISTVISSTTKKSLTTQLPPTLSKSSLSNTAETSTPQLSTEFTTTPTTSSNLPTTYIYGEAGCSPNPWRKGLLELFTEWSQIAKRNNIEYVIFYGTLLGAMRTGDVIPYDSDIDLLMDVNYFPKMKDIAVTRGFDNFDGKIRLVIQPEFDYDIPSTSRKRYTCKGKITPHMVDQCSFQEPLARLTKGNVHIDFYHFYDRGKYLEDPSEDNNKVYQKSDFFPLKPCQFMGIDTMCPQDPWKLLKIYFHRENLDPPYKCKGGKWLDKNGRSA